MPAASLRLGDLRLEGASRAGDATWFRVFPPGLAFDVGRGRVNLSGAGKVFLSHGHLDHALGLPFLLSYRSSSEQSTDIYLPAEILPAVEAFVAAASTMEGRAYRVEFHPMTPGARVGVGPDLTVEAFEVAHRVSALGYHLCRRRSRLLPDLQGRPAEELVRLKQEGEVIEEVWEEDWVSYTGDTAIDVLATEPRLLRSRVLLLECTFLPPKSRASARKWGHTHLEDLLEWAPRLENETLVLFHLSRRHGVDELRSALEARAPALAERTLILGEAGLE